MEKSIFSERITVKKIHDSYKTLDKKEVTICGWANKIRNSKSITFIELNDGTCFNPVQIVVLEDSISNYELVESLNIGSSLMIHGILEVTPQAKQPFEIKATKIEVLGKSTPDFPLQNKRHTVEFLRTIAHLRGRTNLFRAAFRVRSEAAYAIHKFFNEKGFVYMHSPIFTGSDCEGAGEMFQVTTLDLKNVPLTKEGEVDYKKDFFGKKMNLTVTGQLEAEAMAMAFSNVYTFGPAFRSEDSNTTRHAAEFWMVEPEIAFCELSDVMDLEEEMVKYVIKYVMDKCPDEIEFFNSFVDKKLKTRLNNVVNSTFARIKYEEAIKLLEKNKDNFEYPVYFGVDIATEHERYLAETVFKKPVFVTDYPREIKAFYMKENDDKRTVQAVDLLVPGIGEMIGGSQREEDYDKLKAKIEEFGLNIKDYEWYLDTRKYGTVPHGGFGLGFERFLMYITGIANIRDVLPFPRTTGNAMF